MGELGGTELEERIESEVNVKETKLKFKPGMPDMGIDNETGHVTDVTPGGQAEEQGVNKGWQVRKLNDSPFSADELKALSDGSQEYSITFVQQDCAEQETKEEQLEDKLSTK